MERKFEHSEKFCDIIKLICGKLINKSRKKKKSVVHWRVIEFRVGLYYKKSI